MSYSKLRAEYLESEILSAGPVRRVQLLYEGAIDFVCQARTALAAGDIRTRNTRINSAMSIFVELALSLDHTHGGQLGKDLVELYDYAQRRLLEANVTQTDAPLAEVEKLMRTLLDGWKGIAEVPERSDWIAAGGAVAPVSRGRPGFGDVKLTRGGLPFVGNPAVGSIIPVDGDTGSVETYRPAVDRGNFDRGKMSFDKGTADDSRVGRVSARFNQLA